VNTRDLPLKQIDLQSWQASILYTVIARPAVPLFFMMSGFLLLHRVNEAWDDHYRKRLPRILIPLVAWSFIYIGIRFVKPGAKVLGPWEILRVLIFEFPADHLWFLYAMLGFYVALPLFRPMMRLDQRLLFWAVVLWMITDPLAATIQKFQGMPIPLLNLMAFPRFGYFLIGALFKLYPTATQRGILASAVVYFGTALLMVLGTFYVSIPQGKLWDGYTSQNGVFLTLNTIALFPLIRWAAQRRLFADNRLLIKVAHAISEQSYGIYLSHIVFVNLYCVAWEPKSYPGIIRMPVIAVASFLSSYLLVAIMKRIPFVREIVT